MQVHIRVNGFHMQFQLCAVGKTSGLPFGCFLYHSYGNLVISASASSTLSLSNCSQLSTGYVTQLLLMWFY